MSEVLVPRDAATIMLVRDGDGGGDSGGDPALEVCMLRRHLNSDFVGGAYVFPGGAGDPLDAGPEAEGVCQGRSDPEASALLGLAAGGLAAGSAGSCRCGRADLSNGFSTFFGSRRFTGAAASLSGADSHCGELPHTSHISQRCHFGVCPKCAQICRWRQRSLSTNCRME